MERDSIPACRAAARRLPARFRASSQAVVNLLDQLSAQLDDIGSLEDRHIVESMSDAWFLETVEAYLAIDHEERDATYEPTGQRPDDELASALESMRVSLERIAAGVEAGARRELAVHAGFLRERSGSADGGQAVDRPATLARDLDDVDAVTSICAAYGEVLRSRTSARALSDWTAGASPGAPAGVAIGIPAEQEALIRGGATIELEFGDPKVSAHVERVVAAHLGNPRATELVYGYPVVSGVVDGDRIRAPLLLVSLDVEERAGAATSIAPRHAAPRLNLVPFQNVIDPHRREELVQRLSEVVPALPAGREAFDGFVSALVREIPALRVDRWDGTFDRLDPPRTDEPLELLDQAVLQVLPRTSYFLAADLDQMAEGGASGDLSAPVRRLLALDAPTVDKVSDAPREAVMCLPFDANPSQERVLSGLLDEQRSLVRLDGPPGTGKSQTIANVVSHFAATGRTVLVTSTRDPALAVVDEMLAKLDDPTVPMTVLGNNRRRLRRRLLAVSAGPELGPDIDADAPEQSLRRLVKEHRRASTLLSNSVQAEHARRIADEECLVAGDTLLARARRARRRWRAWRTSRHRGERYADQLMHARRSMLESSRAMVRVRSMRRIGLASTRETDVRTRIARVLGRSASTEQYDVFDQLRAAPADARALIDLLPVWIMSPEDVARIFPCEAELFDLVIIDEASQVDLPSALPVLQRGRQALISGDAAQMQPRRLSFLSTMTTDEIWRRSLVHEFDPDKLLHPQRSSLLEAVQLRATTSSMLDEHYRSLPPLIEFSNARWYDGRLRVMTDARARRFGIDSTPIMQVEQVAGRVRSGEQTNEVEARRVVEIVRGLVGDPAYDGATIGVICLYREQADLVRRMMEDIGGLRPEHRLLVGQADQLQGDERDVMVYSLSWDASGMQRGQLSARMSSDIHVQGMLNVMMTRARDEVRIVTSAPVAEFRFASGEESALSAWLAHATAVQLDRAGGYRVDPDADVGPVASAAREVLERIGVTVHVNARVCGLVVPLVVEVDDGPPVAIECDGDTDPSADPLAPSPAQRLEILRRGGFDVQRAVWADARSGRVSERLLEACAPPGSAAWLACQIREDG